MPDAQSSPVPPPGSRPRWRDLGWLVVYGMRAMFELVRARLAFARLAAADIVARNEAAARAARGPRRGHNAAMLARIAYVIPRLSARLPWRSDCVIQAIAAQNWLAAKGLPSEIRIGVERPEATGFGAHAWLVHGEDVVTGGDVARYVVLLSSEQAGEKFSPPGPRAS
jgi:hypothetical protein